MKNIITKAYPLVIRFGIVFAPFVLLFLRLVIGWQLYVSGNGHLHNLDSTTKFFESLHIPMPRANAIISGTTEYVGGILLMAGLATRLIAIPLIFNFCVAYWTDAHNEVIHIFNDPGKFTDYTAFPFLVLALLMLAFGPGLFSIDGILKRTVFRKQSAAVG